MTIVEITPETRARVNAFLQEHWFSTDMVVHGQAFDLCTAAGFLAQEGTELVGLVTYEIRNDVCEILSLDSLHEKQGIGSALVLQVENAAKKCGCARLLLITTNDNLNALRFYQKRGFDMTRVFPNALEKSRRRKPSIPLVGDFGIPLKHEIELVKPLLNQS